MLGRKAVAIFSVLALAATLAGCGSSGSSGATPAAYVKSICQAIGPFEKDIVSRTNALNLSSIKSPVAGKTALQGFLSAVAADTDAALTKLKAAGSPNVNNGKAISNAIVQTFSQLKAAFAQAAASAGNLPTSSPQAFKAGADALSATVRSSFSTIGGSLGGLKSPALEKAAKSEPACTSLSA